ncbi:hypothetical protein [Caballeronia sp. LZ003]|uniref:hypothetical protein n=2 Tax=Caballeronia TaxID=1827195 RepID=UPI002863B08D|nr:hypothetical protein [Caballeronia sp. LZ003]MDR5770816.1 hypothetical protein [Caballeronia sp. LZ002]MDR5846253.1 hypothetical protein [Caballeronia sp. LZ003]
MKPLDMRTLRISWPISGLLVVTLGLILFVWFRGAPDDEADRPPAVATKERVSRASAPAPASAPQANAAPDTRVAAVNIFPMQNWQPPPPPPPPPESIKPPPPPPLPPLPFVVRSLWLDQQGIFYVVLSGTGREFPLCINCKKTGFLRKGDVLLNAYKIEDINRKEVRFMYLPLKRRQTLSLGELK